MEELGLSVRLVLRLTYNTYYARVSRICVGKLAYPRYMDSTASYLFSRRILVFDHFDIRLSRRLESVPCLRLLPSSLQENSQLLFPRSRCEQIVLLIACISPQHCMFCEGEAPIASRKLPSIAAGGCCATTGCCYEE